MEYIQALCKLHLNIVHEVSGNYTKMNNIMKRSGVLEFASNKYFQYNLFQALFMEGLIDLVWKESGLIWCVNKNLLEKNDEDKYLFAENLLKEKSLCVKISSKKQPLIFCKKGSSIKIDSPFYNVCSIGEVADASVIEESITNLSSSDIEVYSYLENKWEQKEFLYDESSLLRIKDKFYGYKYIIFLVESNRTLRVIEPEWLFIISAYILNFDFNEIFRLDNQLLKIKSSFRLPTIISRYLFNNCEDLELDYIHCYRKLSVSAVDELLKYLIPRSA